MCGLNCVAIASDLRYGIQQQTIADNFHKIFRLTDRLYVGLPGLISDVQTLMQKFRYRLKLYELKEERIMKPKVFANMCSAMLYEKRFGPYFVEPIVAGLEEIIDPINQSKTLQPYICAMDLIGAQVFTDDFLVGGTASEQLYGICEALYKPNMDTEQLFETISQCLLAAVDRDCLSGWGAIVHIITPEGVTQRELKSRKD